MSEQRIIAALVYPGLQLLDIVGPLETFNLAAQQLLDDGDTSERLYKVIVIARNGVTETSMSGLRINADRGLDDNVSDIDTLIVPGALTGDEGFFKDAQYIEFVRHANKSVRRMCSVCSGAMLLAASGLLDGKRATTHWMDADELKDCYPDVRVEADQIYLQDGNIYTSGGITAGIDLALSLVEQDHSRRLALKVAKRLLVFLKRPGDQLQFNSFIAAQTRPTKFAAILNWTTDNLESDIDTAMLASKACMSQRTFRRRFESEIGMTVKRYLSRARVTKAQSLLETTSLPMTAIATRCGFHTTDAMRYAFASEIEVTPSDYRRRFGETVDPQQIDSL